MEKMSQSDHLSDFDLSFVSPKQEVPESKETEKTGAYFPHFDDKPDRQVLLPLNYWEKDQQGRPTLWVVGNEDQKDYAQYGGYRYDIPAEWLEGARAGNTESWKGKFLAIALAPDGTLIQFEPPLAILASYPKKWQTDLQATFTPPQWGVVKANDDQWYASCNGELIPSIAHAKAQSWGELWPLKQENTQ